MLSGAWILNAKIMYLIIILIIIFMQTCLYQVNSNLDSDEVGTLPGQPPVGFKQFAGYITVDGSKQRSLFYYFVEAESNPSSKPLVLWFNGGPGCSSVGAGAFVEHGPFKPSGSSVLLKNDYSWNKEANMLYLESPAGVGFSYAVEKSPVNDVTTDLIIAVNDNELNVTGYCFLTSAGDNLAFLEKWLEKYPEYKNREFYITGESYGGHYVPQLATLIVHSKVEINLKGISIGNPLLEFDTDFNSRGEYLWSHGLISDATFDMLNRVCNYSTIRRQGNFKSITPTCSHVAKQASKEIGSFVNDYDITLDVCLSDVFSQTQVLEQNDIETKVDVCVEDETTKYLNREDVQASLNARLVGVNEWAPCNERSLNYDMNSMEEPMTPVLASLLKSGIMMFIYSGDQDSVIPLIGTRLVVNDLANQLGLKITVPYRSWFSGNQVGGWTQVYDDVLTFATIRGASHEAPFSQPERSINLFRGFLSGKPLPSEDEVMQKDKNQHPSSLD